jgi:hypothetical protein
MSATVLGPAGSSRVLLVLTLLVSTVTAAQVYAPPPPQNYAPPPQQNYAPPPQQNYAPPPQNYAPPQNYVPPQQGYAPPPPQNYAPPPPQNYVPPQQGYAPPPPAAAVVGSYAAAYPTPDEVSRFVSKISSSTRFDRRVVARWRAPLCFNVQGLPDAQNHFVLARLAQIASNSGAQLQNEGCSKGAYNFNVVFTLDADQVAHDWYALHRDMFDTNASNTQLRRFLNPPTPTAVRVWHDATLFGSDGLSLIPVNQGDPVEPLPDFDVTGSRLPTRGAIGLNFAVVIIDGKLAAGAGLAQLADYAAMVGLADLDLDAEVGPVPTILRLFAEAPQLRPAGLTAWDQAFLNALYHSEASPRSLRAQLAGSVVHVMAPP